MSRDLLLSLMRKGKNGNELLAILDAIVNNEEPVMPKAQPTLEPLTF